MPRWPLFPCGIGLALLCGLCLVSRASPPKTVAPSSPTPVPLPRADASELIIAVADFSGKDKDFGRFLADTLLTDLAQSPILHMVERDEISRVLTELKLQATGLTEPQVQKVGRLIGANHLIVGSYLQVGNRLILNVRLLNVDTGRVSPGGAANVAGPADDILGLVNRLARLLHLRLTGKDLPLDPDMENRSLQLRTVADSPSTVPGDALLAPPPAHADSTGEAEAQAPDDRVVTEGELVRYLQRFGKVSFTMTHPNAAVSRLRTLVAIVRALVPPDQISDMGREVDQLADGSAIPYWARPYVDAALAQGLWMPTEPLRPQEPATWLFVRTVVSRAPGASSDADSEPVGNTVVRSSTSRASEDIVSPKYTGLLVDARNMPVQRDMSLRILDEDGRLVYPPPEHMPDPDFVDVEGTASYAHTQAETRRAGAHPMRVNALRVQGDDIIISRTDADRILAEDRRDHFLWNWNVCILVDADR
ncbi:MAG TPA: CsgG/HfaB family protein [Chthonomonas sp.]|uniref:CsgG/HfaB family protein n=1 Tax=Chthonomonas sp. TaxID=2282153 RepID=UPI002B4B19D7|nr:CsgG/HfaB family protein [Chthonomonas sp.]HLI47837.1 CsgG/HfaB family protein [Chthonomonas sp.]